MSPQPKKFESEAEKQKAYRERKKSLLQKLKDAVNGKSNEDTVQDNKNDSSSTGKSNIISNEEKPSGTAIFLPPRENAPSTKEPLKSKKSTGRCELCGILMGYRECEENPRCSFCQQFQSKEEMLYARDLRRRLVRSENSTVNRELERIYDEEMRKWRVIHK